MDKAAAIEKTIDRLKNFQLATVNHIIDQFDNGQKRMLVADEVGLGKTIVASGVIAKLYEQHRNRGKNKSFHVVYICSNQALAKQNLRKLNLYPSREEEIFRNSIGRLIFLALKQKRITHKNEELDFQLSALTPGTSLKLTNREGRKEERAVIYHLLLRYNVFQNKKRKLGLKWFLKFGVDSNENWLNVLNDEAFQNIEPEIATEFKKVLMYDYTLDNTTPELYQFFNNNSISYWEVLKRFCASINRTNYNKGIHRKAKYELIKVLRQIITEICISDLKANLFILDEFQRFKEIIKTNKTPSTPAERLAQKVFANEHGKVLLLSATPFKPYTTKQEEAENEENHAKEFKDVFKFLKHGSNNLMTNTDELQSAFFEMLKHPKLMVNERLEEATQIKTNLENHYRQVMARTERRIVITTNALKSDTTPNIIHQNDIQDYVNYARLADDINKEAKTLGLSKISASISFSKSVPYVMSFAKDYAIYKRLKHHGIDTVELKKRHTDCFLNYDEINNYTAQNFPNAKLRRLIEATQKGFKLLWLPPSLPYYTFEGAYKDCDYFSKTLVFSAWKMVPRAIATLVSYEAERQLFLNKNEHYFGKTSSTLLDFSVTDKVVNKMTSFCLVYPCQTLAEHFNPSDFVSKQPITLDELSATIRTNIKKQVLQVIGNSNNIATRKDRQNRVKWFWLMPLLLDKTFHYQNTKQWLATIKSHFQGDDLHLEELKSFFNKEEIVFKDLPPIEELVEVLTNMALGSPAIALYRTFKAYSNNETTIRDISFKVAREGFFALFNKEYSRNIVDKKTEEENYWLPVLKYCKNGNVQSMLDEYVFMIKKECKSDLSIIADHLIDTLKNPTTTLEADFGSRGEYKMRCHYATAFGHQKTLEDKDAVRVSNIRKVFNSPFRPFVLASTSIGQEGLDFHYYCRQIMHWNLPNNPIDLEQREGRINRYQGLVIRQKIATQYLNYYKPNAQETIWQSLFKIANHFEKQSNSCDLVPHWHINGQSSNETTNINDIHIERIVPLLPYSKDKNKLDLILKVLAYYRLVFGQPDQENLMQVLHHTSLTKAEHHKIMDLLIDLSPYSHIEL